MAFLKSFRSFPKNFYAVITMEFFERGAYYGVTSVLATYMVLSTVDGGLGFSEDAASMLFGIITAMIYAVPIISGAIAEKYGYKKILGVSFLLMSAGYYLTGISHTYGFVLASLMVLALGAGLFKPLISGTIAKVTNESNSTLGFGIFYWTVNLGAFIFPTFLIPFKETLGWNFIFILAAISTGWLFVFNLIAYKEPPAVKPSKSIGRTLAEAALVVLEYKFMILVLIYSLFWVMYFQTYTSVLWYVKDYLDMSGVNNFMNSFLSIFVNNPDWKFGSQNVTSITAGVIIVFQLLVSSIVKNKKALPTMIVGIGLASVGMAMLTISSTQWLFIASMMVFTFGEMVAHPKFISYVGLIAPNDKKALYLGYSFLTNMFGALIGGFLGGRLYTKLMKETYQPDVFWMIFSCIGVLSIAGILLYNRFFGKSK